MKIRINKKTIIKLVGVLVALFLLIQLIPNKRPAVTMDNPSDLIQNTKMPPQVARMIQTSCYDCHSMETKYPWYDKMAPATWLVYRDIRVGRRKLNFSDWTKLSTAEKLKALNHIGEEVGSGDMPFLPYAIIHKKARLNKEQRKIIVDWTKQYSKDLFYAN
ncbi:MAG: heme-binding domain-containing protein [Bacteroidales bacterium]|nr:heme-binding domain-containing protein [Bacteroidales bacterium]